MEFWSRLVAGTSLASSGKKKTSSNNSPEKRLARFKREYSQLLQSWRNTSSIANDTDAATSIQTSLRSLMAILTDESRRPLPHPCITCAASQQIYLPVGKIATTAHHEGIIRESVALFATLLDSEEEQFVADEGFSKSLMNLLVRITGANSIRLGLDTEMEVVELAFNITTKIRLEPDVLPAWFAVQHLERSQASLNDAHALFTGKTHKEDFPLFYLLIDYIHHDGRIGDFARTGLLYMIEAASTSLALEQWIVESDLATLMATGLGALYSQLSRKLVIDYPPDDLPPILAFSDYEHPTTTMEIVASTSLDFQAHMDTFLSHLLFWQDVLNHCKSGEVKQTLLEHFQVIFLQQLLYPSLLESSDLDGGSSVAVLTYLRRILEALDHPDMIHLILHYLLALPDDAPTSAASRASVSAARHRKSVDLAAMMASHSELPSTPALFNLVDLIEGNLRSTNQQTISVALQLISVILRRHHRYAVPTLLRTSRLLHDEPRRTMGAHEGQVHLLLALAGELGGQDAIHAMYEDHIHDCTNLLESHPCSVDLIAPSTTTDATPTGVPLSMPGAHTLRLDDPLLELMIGTLQGFFSNAVETNLSLTATIVDLAGCGYMHIDGWLLPDPSSYVYDSPMHDVVVSDDDDELAQLALIRRARIAPNLEQTPLPALLATLRTLVSQACAYASTLPRFEGLLQQRREAFSTASAQSPPSHVTSPSRSVSTDLALGRQSPFDALASKLFLDLPSRSKSPRGRRRDDGSSTPGSSTPLPRTMQHRIASSERPPTTIHDSVPISQTLAFAAVDQAILTRKVAVPPPPLQSLPDLAVPPPPPPAQSLPDPDVPEPDTDEPAAASKQPDPTREVSVSHILTNVLVLQDFLLELTALIQVRASLFREVKVV